jgi:pyruvate dehydrogenase E2 component (dihydrolipoamide acetyltransferase)
MAQVGRLTHEAIDRLHEDLDLQNIPSYWASVDGLNIHFKRLGSGQPTILIHGGGGDWTEWRDNLVPLAQGLRVIAPDMPGFGLSQSPDRPLRLRWAVSFLVDFMTVTGTPKAHFVGHSLGGMLALALALDHPDKVSKLCLVDSAGLGDIRLRTRIRFYVIRGIARLATGRDIPQLASGLYDRTLPGRIQDLRCPTMIIWGKHDRYLPTRHAQLAHRAIQQSVLSILGKSGHAPQREQAEEFNRIVYEFLTS